MQTGDIVPWPLMLGRKQIDKILKEINELNVTSCRRSANAVADQLAKLVPPLEIMLDHSLPLHIWETYSEEVCMHKGHIA